jgi:hypothetical protein
MSPQIPSSSFKPVFQHILEGKGQWVSTMEEEKKEGNILAITLEEGTKEELEVGELHKLVMTL